MTMNTDETRSIRKFSQALKAVRMATDPTIPSQVVQAFIAVVMNEGKSLTEIAEAMGARLSTASRQLLDLGERNRRMEPGYGLIDRKQDPMNLRVNIYTLTPKGRMLAETIIRDMEDA